MSPAPKNRFLRYCRDVYFYAPGWLRKLLVATLGSVVLLTGFITIFTPGPAFLLIPAGLAIFSFEFAWAARLLKKTKERLRIQDKHLPQWARSREEEPSTPPVN